MKVKIKTGFWVVREYLMSIEETGLLLLRDNNEWHIPYAELVRFSLHGPSERPDKFTLETKSKSYDGRFVDSDDAKEMINQLSKRSGQKLEISLTVE